MPARSARQEEQDLTADLEAALGTDQIRLEYQPVVRLGSGHVAGAEALVRWRHPRRGMLGPAEFIPAAERGGLIDRLGQMVLEQACRTAAGWPRPSTKTGYFVSVNVATEQLADTAAAEQILGSLAATGLPAGSLILEITNNLGAEGERVARAVAALREAGVRVALDDFGSATSLRDLKQLGIDFVKLDREFVVDVDGPPADAAFALAVLRLAEARGAEAVAKGIESREQAWRLAELGCRYGQGYLFSKPLGASGIVAILRQGTLRG
ncbi:MAG TPA: EAL domain-containing protein [Candidatus Limnocylindrales bacterium]|nr:EAL domain-containing protein [Candidatus Limnocylindrales bacterium]